MTPESILPKPARWQNNCLWLAFLAMLAFAPGAQARITCTPSSIGFATAYGTALNVTAASFTVICTRNARGGSIATYQATASNGLHAAGTQRRAASGGSFLNYNLSSDPGCLTAWNTTAKIPALTYSTPALGANASDIKIYPFYGCVPAGQVVPAAGTYTDTITVKLAGTGARFVAATFPVSITAPATCALSTPPGNINFNYTSFSAAPVFASTTFAATCTNLLPYTMALDAVSGTVVGVNYALALSAASATGNGLAQTFSINGSIAAGQSGTCTAATCAGSQVRTLTISF